jgi:hypothetical protein
VVCDIALGNLETIVKSALEIHRDRIVPYRMRAACIFNLALRHEDQWPAPRSMKIYFDDVLFIEGLSTGFTNAAIESGIMNCRALLEFLGLKATSPNQLAQRGSLRRGDIGIEDFELPLIEIAEVTAKYRGDESEAESSIATLITTANKWLAHNTTAVELDGAHIRSLEIASRGIPALVVSYFYTRLGMPAPGYQITHRRRTGDAFQVTSPK